MNYYLKTGTRAQNPKKNMKKQPKNEICLCQNDVFLRVNFQQFFLMEVKTIFFWKMDE